jgi:hypothetical protein
MCLRIYASAVEAQAAGKFEVAAESEELRASRWRSTRSSDSATRDSPPWRVTSTDLRTRRIYIKQAFQLLGGMTEREKFATRGLYYRIIGDNQQCAKEYSDS